MTGKGNARIRFLQLRLAGLLALLLIASACSGEPSGSGSKARERTPNLVLDVALTEPDAIDPMKASNRSGNLVVKQICDTLVGFDPKTGALKPAIAESWSASPDAKVFTFKIRPGVKFHNGRELTAEDYVWSMSRFVNRKTGSKQNFFFERVVGYPDVLFEKNPRLSGVKALDPRTLQIELTEPWAEFPTVMANPVAGAAIPKEAVEAAPEAFAAQPVCTGAYRVEAPWTKGADIELIKWAEYYAKNDALADAGTGRADKIRFRHVATEEQGYDQLSKGEMDIASVPLTRLVQARKTAGRVSSGVNGHVAYIGFPVKKPPFDNLGFRKSLAMAIDRKAIIGDLLAGSRKAPQGYLPASAGPGASGSACEGAIAPGSNLDGAKQALAESGINPVTTKMTMYFNAAGGHERWLQDVLDQWKSGLGLDATLKPDTWDAYLKFLEQPGPDGPFRLAWAVKFPSPEALYDPLFAAGSLDNFSGFSNPEFDAALKKARSAVDDEARRSAYEEAGAVLCSQLPIAPMWFGQNHYAYADAAGPSDSELTPRLDIFGEPVLRGVVSRR